MKLVAVDLCLCLCLWIQPDGRTSPEAELSLPSSSIQPQPFSSFKFTLCYIHIDGSYVSGGCGCWKRERIPDDFKYSISRQKTGWKRNQTSFLIITREGWISSLSMLIGSEGSISWYIARDEERMNVLHENSGGIRKSIPSALEISLDTRDFHQVSGKDFPILPSFWWSTDEFHNSRSLKSCETIQCSRETDLILKCFCRVFSQLLLSLDIMNISIEQCTQPQTKWPQKRWDKEILTNTEE